jgi:SpoIID/LytB domain protein
MLIRRVSVLTAIIFLITLFPTFSQNTYAYQSNAYFNNVKIGLISMSSTNLNLTLEGSYTVNGQVYPTGSSLKLAMSGTSLTLNGVVQSQMILAPAVSTCLLAITNGTTTNKYMGDFIFKIYNSKILPINTLDIENYLKGVVGYEMSDYFPIDALKAQAVAARNFALSRIGWEAAKGYDFDDTTSYQVYKGYISTYSNVISAVEQTKGQVLLYNDKLVETLYSAAHGGISENSENVWGNYVPYLRSVTDSYENNPWPNGNIVLTNTSIKNTLVAKGYILSTDNFIKLDLSSITRFPSGRVSSINIIYSDSTGIEKTKAVTKDVTRTFLSLPSNLYTVTYDAVSGAYTFSGKGNGHGLGMSQIGAKNRAAAGQTYAEILGFYYQNVYLQNLILKASLNSVTQSSNSLLVGRTICFNTSATGGNGYGYLYKYVVKNGNEIVLTSDYSNNSTFQYTPAIAGNYAVETYVKDVYSISDYDATKTSYFTVYENTTLNSFSLNKTETLVGQQVSTDIVVQGGSGKLQYKYEVAKAGVIVMTRDFSEDKQFSYNPETAGSYIITVYVKDALSSNEYDLKQQQSFEAYNSLTINSFNRDIINPYVGDTINFSSSFGGGSSKGIRYKYIVLKNGSTAAVAVATREFNENSGYSYTPNEAGSYEIDVYAVDAISDNAFDIMDKMNFTVIKQATISSLTIDKNTVFVNNMVTVNAEVNNNVSDVLYKFVVKKDGQQLPVFTRDFSLSTSVQYTPESAGSYNVVVYAKDCLSTKEYDDFKTLDFSVLQDAKINSVQTDKPNYFTGQVLNVNVESILGSANYLYKYVIAKDGVAIATQDYSSASGLIYNLSDAGMYNITVYMKDVLSNREYDDMQTCSVKAYDQPTMNFSSTKAAVIAGNAVSYTIIGMKGSGVFQYRYVIFKDGSVKLDSSYSSSNTFSYTETIAGEYQVVGYLKDSLSEKIYDAQSTLILNVYNPQITSASVYGSFYEGKTLSFNTSTTGASPSGVGYRYEIYNNGQLKASSSYSASPAFSFTPNSTGTYTTKIYIKDGLSNSEYDCMKEYNIAISNKPLYLATLPLSYGMTNNDILSLQNALTKLGYNVGIPNGYFGKSTKNAVTSFQKSKGLSADGIVGNMTYGALNEALIQKAGVKTLTF